MCIWCSCKTLVWQQAYKIRKYLKHFEAALRERQLYSCELTQSTSHLDTNPRQYIQPPLQDLKDTVCSKNRPNTYAIGTTWIFPCNYKSLVKILKIMYDKNSVLAFLKLSFQICALWIMIFLVLIWWHYSSRQVHYQRSGFYWHHHNTTAKTHLR